MATDPKTIAARHILRPQGARASALTLIGTECAQLRIRIVALENLVVAMLAQAPNSQIELAREMAMHISPRPGFTAHRLTLHAADAMRSLVVRARRFQSASASHVTRSEEST